MPASEVKDPTPDYQAKEVKEADENKDEEAFCLSPVPILLKKGKPNKKRR